MESIENIKSQIDLLFSKYEAFVEILKQKENWCKRTVQYALQIIYFLHCGFVVMNNDNNKHNFIQFVDKSNNTRKIKDLKGRVKSFSTYHVKAHLLSSIGIQTCIDVLHKDNENQQINKCSYLALELIIDQNIKKKNKKQQWKDLLDRLQMLDTHDMLENYVYQVLSIVSYIDFSTITTTTTDY
jgi:hypothetical protein